MAFQRLLCRPAVDFKAKADSQLSATKLACGGAWGPLINGSGSPGLKERRQNRPRGKATPLSAHSSYFSPERNPGKLEAPGSPKSTPAQGNPEEQGT